MRHNPRLNKTRERIRKSWLAAALLSLLSPLTQPAAHAFGGEDPASGPFHHEELSENAATDAGFSVLDWTKQNRGKGIKFELQPDPKTFKAGEIVAWHADYLDSYLYNPLWWAQGLPSMNRLKASLSITPDLERVHFDDLFDSNQVRFTWRRYVSGAVAGLIWAKEHDDVAGAQNIVGVSLHAMQDFYSHSNWIDDPTRRDKTLFEIPVADRERLHLYTGAYEHEETQGVKHHGKFMFQCTVFTKPGVKEMMKVLCGAASPMGNLEICKDFDACETGVAVTPEVKGVKLPPGALYIHPGIAVDTGYTAAIGVEQRGLTDITPEDALKTALTLGERQSLQWLQTLDKAMTKAGPDYASFWQRVKTSTPSVAERQAQYENFSKFPFQFMSAGAYPAEVTTAEQFFLRLKIKTGNSSGAGTDADIKVRADEGANTVLDYMHHKSWVLAHNDFEKNDEAVYALGPFSSLPQSVTFTNDAADAGDVIKATAQKVVDAVEAPFKLIGGILGAISGKEADWIQSTHRVWMPSDLATVTATPQLFRLFCNGGDRGNYNVIGYISKTGESGEGAEATHSFKVRLSKLQCVKESKADRGSNSDEPFLLSAPSALPGQAQPYLAGPFEDVDTGEERDINREFDFTVSKDYGMINVPVSVMEHDDESAVKRQELLNAFAGKLNESEDEERAYLDTIGAAIGADWQLGNLEVTAWSRNGAIKVGTVHNATENKWVKGKKSLTVNFNNLGGFKNTGLTTDELMPYLPPGTTPTEPTEPTTPEAPTTPETPELPTTPDGASAEQIALLEKFVGKWQTPWGVLTLTRNGDKLNGIYRRLDPVTRTESNGETVELTASPDAKNVLGPVTFGNTATGGMNWTLGINGDSFTGNYDRGGLNPHNGTRIKDGTSPTTPNVPPTTPTIPTTPTVPPTIPTVPTTPATPNVPPTIPTVPTTPNIPTTPTTPNAGGAFRALGDWSVQIESMRVARGDEIEVVAIYKNTKRQRGGLGAGDVSMVLTDADGVGIRNVGNLYRASGDPDMEPEKFNTTVNVESGSTARVLALFEIPKGMTSLKTLTVFGYRTKPLTFNASNLELPDPIPALQLPVSGAVGGTGAFADLDDNLSLRFDGARRGRNNSLQLFLTVKNLNKEQFVTHPGFTLDVAVTDQDGLTITDEGNLYRASGEGLDPEKISHGITIVPGGEATIVYPVKLPNGAIPKSLLVNYGDKKLTFGLPDIPATP